MWTNSHASQPMQPLQLAASRSRRPPRRGRSSPCCRGRDSGTGAAAVPRCARMMFARGVRAHLHRDLRHARAAACRSAPSSDARSPITNTSGWPGIVRSGWTSTRPARSSGTPSVAPSGDAATPAAHSDRLRVDPLARRPRRRPGATCVTGCAGAHLDAEPLEIAARRVAQRLRKRRQHGAARLDQQDARRRGIDVAEVARQRLPRDLRERAGQLDAGRAAADDDERQQRAAPRGIASRARRARRRAARAGGSRARPRAS